MNKDTLLIEQCGTLGRKRIYAKDEEHNKVIRISSSDTLAKTFAHRLQDLFREIFFPHGFPDSVSEDYLEYQLWDTTQAFCSTITGTFATQAILISVGVGDSNATPLAAAITWVMKDGTGMIGRILFAWCKGNDLDADCKKWRFVADILNDVAMFLELLVPYLRNASLQMLCMTTSIKAVVGVAGSATRASVTQHQAINGNMADVSAKDGSQETLVNLVASFIGIILLTVFIDTYSQWMMFLIFTFIHLIANYFAVCSLSFQHLNIARFILVLHTYFKFGTVPNPSQVNRKEPVIIGCGRRVKEICGFNIVLGEPLTPIPTITSLLELTELVEIYKTSNYFLLPDIKKKMIYVALQRGETSKDVLSAYFHAVLLGIVICHYNEIPVNVSCKRQLHHVTPIMRLYSVLKIHPKNSTNIKKSIPTEMLVHFNEQVFQEITMLFTALNINGWDITTHSIKTGQWRARWKYTNNLSTYNDVPEYAKGKPKSQ